MKTPLSTPEEIHPPLIEARRKQNAIAVERAKLESEIRALRSEGVHNGDLGSNQVNNRVRAILGEIPEAPVDTNSRRIGELLVELDAHTKAEARLYDLVQKELRVASRLVCEKAAGQHKALGKKFADAVIALHKAHTDYYAFLDEVESTGASIVALGAVYPTQMGHPRDPCGGYHYMLDDFLQAKIIDKNSFPEAVR